MTATASPRIVVLDGGTLNPGDNPWEPIARLGEVVVYDQTPAGEITSVARDAEVLVTNKASLTADVLEHLPKLKLIAVTATGYNIVDTAAADRLGIAVCNVPEYGTNSVAQFTIGMILELCHGIGAHAASVAGGEWTRRNIWSYWLSPQSELAGKTLGIIGFGRIGRRVAELAIAFGMRVIATRPRDITGITIPVEWATPETIFADADVVSLHCPLTPTNAKMVGDALLQRMKPSALLINVSRGGLVDEAALARSLHSGTLRGAAVDVVSAEPISSNNPLLSAPNCLITPHIAWAASEARQRLMTQTARNIEAFLNGRPINVVNAPLAKN